MVGICKNELRVYIYIYIKLLASPPFSVEISGKICNQWFGNMMPPPPYRYTSQKFLILLLLLFKIHLIHSLTSLNWISLYVSPLLTRRCLIYKILLNVHLSYTFYLFSYICKLRRSIRFSYSPFDFTSLPFSILFFHFFFFLSFLVIIIIFFLLLFLYS